MLQESALLQKDLEDPRREAEIDEQGGRSERVIWLIAGQFSDDDVSSAAHPSLSHPADSYPPAFRNMALRRESAAHCRSQAWKSPSLQGSESSRRCSFMQALIRP